MAKNLALSDAEDNTSAPLNRRGIADLPLLRALLAIRQKSQEPSFWEVMDSYASLAASGTLCFKNSFTLDLEDLLCWYKRTNDFYEL